MLGKILTTRNGVYWYYHVSSLGYRQRQYEVRLTDCGWTKLYCNAVSKMGSE